MLWVENPRAAKKRWASWLKLWVAKTPSGVKLLAFPRLS